MADIEQLRSLRERVIAATGADREIDAVVWLTLTPGVTRKTTHVPHWKVPYDIDETRDESGRLVIVPEYVASLDAAVALVNRVLPGWWWEIARGLPTPDSGGRFFWASVYADEPCDPHPYYGATPALALLAALLSALIARAEEQTP